MNSYAEKARSKMDYSKLDRDGRTITDYVTTESADRVVMRDAEGQEFSFNKVDIDARRESLVSAMPEGLIKEYTIKDLASILDYLESLPVQNSEQQK